MVLNAAALPVKAAAPPPSIGIARRRSISQER
jgi:hypothetical protein